MTKNVKTALRTKVIRVKNMPMETYRMLLSRGYRVIFV